MANISSIKLPSGNTYSLKDNISGYTTNEGTITQVQTTAGAHTTINVSSGAAAFNVPTKTSHLTNDSGFITNAGVTGVTAGTGLSGGGTSGAITLNHSNSITAQTTQAVYPIKIDAQGHINAYGSAVTIPGISKTTATLTTTWSSNQQTVSVSGITASNTVIVTPAPDSYDAYCEAGIYCSAQAAGTLTFKCDTVPSASLTVNVVIIT